MTTRALILAEGYRPLAYCRDCGRDFSGDRLFDRHRVGVYDYTYADGLRQDPPVEDGRRCLDDDELRALGLRPMADDEMRASRRDRKRAGSGVELWIDPTAAERARRTFAGSALSRKQSDVEATEAVKTTDTLTAVQIDLYAEVFGEVDAAA